MQRQFRERRDYLLKLLADVPGMKTNVPDGAFYVFPEVSYYIGKSDGDKIIKDDTDLCLYLLDKAHVALVPGSAFGGVNYIRFSYACSKDDLTESVKRIKKALEQLK